MKFFTDVIGKKIVPLLIVTAAAVLSCWCGAAGSVKNENIALIRRSLPEIPLAPSSEDRREQSGVLGNALPGGTPLLLISRRGFEPPVPRVVSGGEAEWFCSTELLPAQISALKEQKWIEHFPFQNFLQCSLPVRAGPELNVI